MAAPSRGLVGAIGAIALFFAGRTVVVGELNMGGKGAPDYWVSFETHPLMFTFGVLSMALIGVLALVHWWRTR